MWLHQGCTSFDRKNKTKQKRQIQILQILQILQSLVLQTLHQTSFKFVGKKKQNNLLPTNFHFNNVPAFRMKRKTSWRRQFAKMFIFHLYLFLYLNLFTSFSSYPQNILSTTSLDGDNNQVHHFIFTFFFGQLLLKAQFLVAVLKRFSRTEP